MLGLFSPLKHASPPLHTTQSLMLAPLFVWFELLFHLGYRPQLFQQITSRIREIQATRQSQQEPLLRSTK